MKFSAGIGLVIAALFASAVPALAQEQPCQWNYENVAGVATATYCGNVISKGTTNFASLPNIPALTAVSNPFANETFSVAGYQGGIFTWIIGALPCDPSTGGGDQGITFCTSDGQGGYLTSGYWKRQFSGSAFAEWFGIAFNTPTIDQATKWNAMVASLANQGIPLFQDGMIYGSSFALPQSLTLSCAGRGTGWAEINSGPAGNIVKLLNGSVGNLDIRHCDIDGNASNNTNVQMGLNINDSTIAVIARHYFLDIFIHDTTDVAADIVFAARDSIFDGIRTYKAGKYGIQWGTSDAQLTNCNIGQSAQNGLYIQSATGIITNCKVWGSGQYIAANIYDNVFIAGSGAGGSNIVMSNILSQEATGYGFHWFRSGSAIQTGGSFTNLKSDGDGIAASQGCFNINYVTQTTITGSCGKSSSSLAGTPANGILLGSSSTGNSISLTIDPSFVTSAIYAGAATAKGNTVYINGDPQSIQYVPYASTVTPIWTLGDTLVITDTGAITMLTPSQPVDGKVITLQFVCGASCAIPTFSSAYAKDGTFSTSFSTTSGNTNSISFKYNSSLSKWQQFNGGSYAVN